MPAISSQPESTRSTSAARASAWVRRHRSDLLLFAAALLWFLPGIWWGLPIETADTRMGHWGSDELGPLGAINAVRLALLRSDGAVLTPQYPLAHLFIQALFVWPYHLAVLVADNLGFPAQRDSVAILTLLHRAPSLLMAAGTVVVARAAGRRVGGDRAGWMAAAAVAVIGPLVYYARTSNVDAGGLFWSALALLIAIASIRDGFTTGRAAAIGLSAAMGTATKDQHYAFFLGLGVAVLLLHLSDRRRAGDWNGWWRAPAVGVTVGAAAYLAVSGILLLPSWFLWHLQFIAGAQKAEASPAIQVLRGSYFSNPATVTGYAHVAREATTLIGSAIGAPLLALALLGIGSLLRRDRRLLLLFALPVLFFAVGVIGPVRFVRPRFLLSVDFILCLLAAIAVAAAARWPAPLRRAIRLGAVAGIAWATLRGVDLTVQMVRDGRYRAGDWLARVVQPGDTVAYYGAPGKLPRLPAGVVITPAPGQLTYDRRPATSTPHFIVSIPQQPIEADHEWSVADSTFRRMSDGSAGYDLILDVQTPAIWPRPLGLASYVNARVRVFARKDVVARMAEPPQERLPSPD